MKLEESPAEGLPVGHDMRVAGALASETSARTLRLLAAADGEVCVCEVEAALDAEQSTVSRALSRLHDAGLVTRRKAGRWRYYRPTPGAGALLSALDTVREGADD